MPVDEVSTIRGHTELPCQPKEGLFQVPAKFFRQVSEREAIHVRQENSRDIAGVEQMQFGVALHGKAARLLDDSVIEFVVGGLDIRYFDGRDNLTG